jgi:hypothetical protein
MKIPHKFIFTSTPASRSGFLIQVSPINDCKSFLDRHNKTADASIEEVGRHLIPHQRYIPQSLTNFQHQVEYGNTCSCQQDKIMDQKCICKQLKTGILQYTLHSLLHDKKKNSFWLIFSMSFSLVRNVSHIIYRIFSAYLHSLWECRLVLRL